MACIVYNTTNMANKTIFHKDRKEKSFIPNSIIEELFFIDCTPDRMKIYMDAIREGATNRATATASKDVRKWYKWMHETLVAEGYDLEYQSYLMFEKNKQEE